MHRIAAIKSRGKSSSNNAGSGSSTQPTTPRSFNSNKSQMMSTATKPRSTPTTSSKRTSAGKKKPTAYDDASDDDDAEDAVAAINANTANDTDADDDIIEVHSKPRIVPERVSPRASRPRQNYAEPPSEDEDDDLPETPTKRSKTVPVSEIGGGDAGDMFTDALEHQSGRELDGATAANEFAF